ncbi:hypothetical protein D1BOALGB6SA_10332 [Olavius sp. associated proteobacterium Delta 1]|nr:hypothetical protein D1BOALGB6SA_10332 [Olavius sp. associated proteobacterium Delta 1]
MLRKSPMLRLMSRTSPTLNKRGYGLNFFILILKITEVVRIGYSTDFQGELKFKNELTASQIAHLKKFLGEDRRDIDFADDAKVYKSDKEYWYHIDLEFNDDFSGLRWNGSEKTYSLPEIVNFLTEQMRMKWPEFELTGKMAAQGEEIDDRWELVMKKGVATKVDVMVKGKKVTCPHCEEDFLLE